MDQYIIDKSRGRIDNYVKKLEKRIDEMLEEGEIDAKSFLLFKKTLDTFGTPEAEKLSKRVSEIIDHECSKEEIARIEAYEELKQSRMPH